MVIKCFCIILCFFISIFLKKCCISASFSMISQNLSTISSTAGSPPSLSQSSIEYNLYNRMAIEDFKTIIFSISLKYNLSLINIFNRQMVDRSFMREFQSVQQSYEELFGIQLDKADKVQAKHFSIPSEKSNFQLFHSQIDQQSKQSQINNQTFRGLQNIQINASRKLLFKLNLVLKQKSVFIPVYEGMQILDIVKSIQQNVGKNCTDLLVKKISKQIEAEANRLKKSISPMRSRKKSTAKFNNKQNNSNQLIVVKNKTELVLTYTEKNFLTALSLFCITYKLNQKHKKLIVKAVAKNEKIISIQ